ncbi:MAG: GntR family transcriptional regulator [Chloroflexi bacterium]|nr:GntR family transcriptional regulator [Chloroflexota bacterium]
MKLHREAPDPLYLQLKASIVSDITSRRYNTNQRLPSERELALRDVRARGNKPTSRVLKAKVIPSPSDVAIALRLTPNAEVIQLSRLRVADGKPLALETAYLPFALFPNLLNHNFANESLYAVLENEYKVVLTQAEQTIEAALAEPDEIKLLKLDPPAAVLRIQRLTLTSDGIPVEYVLSAYRGDRYKFRSNLQAR